MKAKYNEYKIIENKLDLEKNRLFESIMSISNGYMGMRGNFEEKFSGDSLKGIYIGGVWYPDKTRVGWWKNGYPEYFGKVINSPNYIGINIIIDGKELDLANEEIVSYNRELDMRNGLLERKVTIKRDENLYELEFRRFLSLYTKEICAINVRVKSLTKDSSIKIISYIDVNIVNEDSNYQEIFWNLLDKKALGNDGYILAQTKENDFGVEQFEICDYMITKVGDNNLCGEEEELRVNSVYEGILIKGKELVVEKTIAVLTSRDHKRGTLVEKAKRIAIENSEKGFEYLLDKNCKLWAKRWKMADVIIKNNPKLQQGIRYNIFQLFSTYYGEDFRLNIGPKGFTGEKYGGATYWDTEAYIIPMYLSIAPKEVTKNLLKYRHKQLKEAYHNAKQQGLEGALFPMVTFNGIECHNEWEITFEEIHRNGAIAYAIYCYTDYTGDYSYVEEKGIEVLIGISRFWADRVHYSKRKNKYMIHGVTGPNEYENNVNNNWYTNFISSWTLQYTIEIIEKIGKDKLSNKLEEFDVTDKELHKWKDIIENMYLPYDDELDIFVQHDGFLDKDLMTVNQLKETDRPLNQNWSWDKILRSCFIKQADVLQGIYFFSNKFSMKDKKNNYMFYEPMTVHESSLSACIHSILACEIGLDERAVEMYERTARLDLDNYNNDTDDGLHITSMSGSWLSIVQGFAGMRTFGEKLSFKPIVPTGWDGYNFNINYRNRLINVDTTNSELKISLRSGKAVEVEIYGKVYLLEKEINLRLQ